MVSSVSNPSGRKSAIILPMCPTGQGPAWKRALFAGSLLFALGLFLGFGLLLAAVLGFEYDEVIFARVLQVPNEAPLNVQIGAVTLPLMIVSYAGALKSLLFGPLFQLFGYTVGTVRIPALMLAALSLALLGRLAFTISGQTAALFCVWLLCTDATLLTTVTCDWGPVVLQNLLLVAGLLCFESWPRHRRGWLLFLGGLAFGLALWDKAIFIWNLSSMLVALLLVQGRALLRQSHRCRSLATVAAGLFLGVSPLIWFNVTTSGRTVHENNRFSTQELSSKFTYLRLSLNGEAAANSFVDRERPAPDKAARPLAHLARALSHSATFLVSVSREWLFVLLVPLGLWLAKSSERRWILFFLISASLAWLQSAITVGAGRSIHHAVLIWPLLYAGLGICAAAVSHRAHRIGVPAMGAMLVLFSLAGLWRINLTYANLLNYSPVVAFSNADAALSAYLKTAGIQRVLTTDWGIEKPVAVRAANLRTMDESFSLRAKTPIGEDLFHCQAPECVLVGHTDARELMRNNQFLRAWLQERHMERRELAVIADTHGTPTFEVFEVVASADGKQQPLSE
jgi:hypothetical protein